MTRTTIDLYPGDLCLEDVPAEFSEEAYEGDRSVGEDGGIWATLEHIEIGGLTLPREQVLLMVGCKALCEIEKDVSEWLTRNDPNFHAIAAE